MSGNAQAIMKSLSTRFMNKAIQSFDRATMVVVGVCWGAALFMVAFTLFSLHLVSVTGHAAEDAAAAEPILPKVSRKPIDGHDAKALYDRLQHEHPGLNISLGNDNALTVSAQDGTKFNEWLSLLRYVDIASPKYRWTLKEFCVGKCAGSLMHAVLVGEIVSFEAPDLDNK
jgi:hypothetical protein